MVSVDSALLRPLGFEGIPIANIENACASGSTAMHVQAIAHIKAGMCDVALVVGAEKMFYPDKRDAMFNAFKGGTDIHRLEEFHRTVSQQAAELIPEQYRDIDGQRSFFMDSYAAQARLHMQKYGTTQRQFAAAAAKKSLALHHEPVGPISGIDDC